jgi:hypothetical protein
MEQERFDEYQVIQTGKVVALDQMGFLVPAGLRIQARVLQNAMLAVAAGGGNINASAANGALSTLTRYTQVDVDNAVVNSRGQLARLGEPVVHSFIQLQGVYLAQYNAAVANTSTAIVIGNGNTVTLAHDVGNHIGFQTAAAFRTSSDAMSRDADEFRAAATGADARRSLDATQNRQESWELGLQNFTVLVAAQTFMYPVVPNRSSILFTGQAVAIGAAMTSFPLGSKVTYNADSDIVPANGTTLAWALTTVDDADADNITVNGALNALAVTEAIVGQVIRRDSLASQPVKAFLNKVSSRWPANVPGFLPLDRMPGSATEGLNYNTYISGTTLGEIQISPLMR